MIPLGNDDGDCPTRRDRGWPTGQPRYNAPRALSDRSQAIDGPKPEHGRGRSTRRDVVVGRAQERILAWAEPGEAIEVSLTEAVGLVLAEPAIGDVDQPPFDARPSTATPSGPTTPGGPGTAWSPGVAGKAAAKSPNSIRPAARGGVRPGRRRPLHQGPDRRVQQGAGRLAGGIYDPSAILNPDKGVPKVLTSVRIRPSPAPTATPGWSPAPCRRGGRPGWCPGISTDVSAVLTIDMANYLLTAAKFGLTGADGKPATATVGLSNFNQTVSISPPG